MNPTETIGRYKIDPDITISTIYIDMPGINYYETMVFGGKHDQYQVRADTLDEAQNNHEKAILMVKSSLSVSKTEAA